MPITVRTCATLMVSILFVLTRAGAQSYYQNPVLPGDHPDPSIIRVGTDFWATSTSSEWGPQFPLLHSRDLVNWELTGAVFAHRPDWASANFWAPEISQFNGRYAVYYVGRKRGGPLSVAVATAEKPEGPYTDHGPLVAQEDGSIDPAPATDENGARYLIWKEDGNSRHRSTPIWAQRLNEDGTKLTGEPHELIRNDAPWEGPLVEGPFILRRGDWFYLFYSGDNCCGAGCHYALGVARARSLLGPWQKNPSNPILVGNETWKCPGHGSIVSDAQGRYYLLYHAYSTGGTIFTGREGLLDEVKFGADDWPTINEGKGPSGRAVSPLGVAQHVASGTYTADFSGTRLDPGWQWPQDFEPVCRLDHGRLLLSLDGSSTNFLAAILARPTTTPDYVATAAIETRSQKRGWSAGLCAIGDSANAVGESFCDDSIIIWRREKDTTRQIAKQALSSAPRVYLRLTARQGYLFQLAFSADGEKWTACGDTAEARNLPPWDRSVRVALTAGGAARAEGCFDSFSIRHLEN